MAKDISKIYRNKERLNTWSHALGIAFGLLGLLLLFQKNSLETELSKFSILVYSATFILLFSASTAYHAVASAPLKAKLRILDHISIYLLIAGTYTPLALIALEGTSGWMIFYTVWGIAALGTLLKLFFTGKFEFISLVLYLVMGWLVVWYFDDVLANVSPIGIHLLFLGGAFYTLGTIFYAVRKIPYNHFIWHLFVLAGAISHWFFIYYGVL